MQADSFGVLGTVVHEYGSLGMACGYRPSWDGRSAFLLQPVTQLGMGLSGGTLQKRFRMEPVLIVGGS